MGLAFLAVLLAGLSGAAATPEQSAEAVLEHRIQAALRADGPFFTPAERAVIERKCGYRRGEWDGFDSNMMNGQFHCTNGRVVDDPEMRALLRVASPRISARVHAAMSRPDIREAISRVAREATARAMLHERERD